VQLQRHFLPEVRVNQKVFFFYGLREINSGVVKNPTGELYSLDVRIVRQNFFQEKQMVSKVHHLKVSRLE
jgi:hypothetical protein